MTLDDAPGLDQNTGLIDDCDFSQRFGTFLEIRKIYVYMNKRLRFFVKFSFTLLQIFLSDGLVVGGSIICDCQF